MKWCQQSSPPAGSQVPVVSPSALPPTMLHTREAAVPPPAGAGVEPPLPLCRVPTGPLEEAGPKTRQHPCAAASPEVGFTLVPLLLELWVREHGTSRRGWPLSVLWPPHHHRLWDPGPSGWAGLGLLHGSGASLPALSFSPSPGDGGPD